MDARKEELKHRTRQFAGRVVGLYIALPLRRAEVAVLGKQMLRSGTSVARRAQRRRRGHDRTKPHQKLNFEGFLVAG